MAFSFVPPAAEPSGETVDLTRSSGNQHFENIARSENVDGELSPQPHVQGNLFPKKKKGGENNRVGIVWEESRDRIDVRARQLLRDIKKRETSGKMIDKQLELTTQLARFELVNNKLEARKMEKELEYLAGLPHPVDWLVDPRPQQSWSTRDGVWGKGVGLGGGENKEFAKITKLADCMKYMNIEAHPQFLAVWYLGGLPAKAAALGVRVVEAPMLCPSVIAFSRTMPRELVGDHDTVKLSALRKNCMRYLYVLPAGDVLRARSLARGLLARRRALGGQLTLLVLDAGGLLRNEGEKTKLEATIADVLMLAEIDTVVVKDADELVTTILQFTRAIAEEPAKLSKRAVDDEATFYMKGENRNCVAVDSEGNGLSRLWQQMLSVLPQSSLEAARAITGTEEFSTPRLLAESVSTAEGAARLGATRVARSAAPGARGRRLGPALASTLCTLFTAKDGNVVVE